MINKWDKFWIDAIATRVVTFYNKVTGRSNFSAARVIYGVGRIGFYLMCMSLVVGSLMSGGIGTPIMMTILMPVFILTDISIIKNLRKMEDAFDKGDAQLLPPVRQLEMFLTRGTWDTIWGLGMFVFFGALAPSKILFTGAIGLVFVLMGLGNYCVFVFMPPRKSLFAHAKDKAKEMAARVRESVALPPVPVPVPIGN